MKKYILGLVTIACFIIGIQANAQLVMEKGDTVTALYSGGSGQIFIYNDIINTSSSSSVNVQWRVTAHDFPAGWIGTNGSNLGICDNYNCYSGTPALLNGTTAPISNPIAANDTGVFDMQLNLSGAPETGTHYLTVNLKEQGNNSNNVNCTFAVTRFSTGVVSVSKSTDDVVLYPNPAREELNVVFDQNSNIKNIAVYNVIGKAMIVYRVSGGSAKLDIDKIPSGVYFIRLSDAKGQVVATKRFTKQ